MVTDRMKEALASLGERQTSRATLKESELQVDLRAATFLLTAAGVNPSLRAAEEKLPYSALRTKDSRLASVSIMQLSMIA